MLASDCTKEASLYCGLKDHHLSFLSCKNASMEQWQKLYLCIILLQKFEKQLANSCQFLKFVRTPQFFLNSSGSTS